MVLVIHENRGLNPHIEDIARRLALDGFMAFAPDALTPLGGYPGDEDKARAAFATLDQAKTREDFLAAVAWLRARPDGNGKLGVVGFCYGGGIAHWLATRLPDLNAAVPFYGSSPAPDQAAQVKAPLLVQLAAVDERINAAWPAYEAALKAAGVALRDAPVPGHAARLQQRHHAALRRGRRAAGVGADDRPLQAPPGLTTRRSKIAAAQRGRTARLKEAARCHSPARHGRPAATTRHVAQRSG